MLYNNIIVPYLVFQRLRSTFSFALYKQRTKCRPASCDPLKQKTNFHFVNIQTVLLYPSTSRDISTFISKGFHQPIDFLPNQNIYCYRIIVFNSSHGRFFSETEQRFLRKNASNAMNSKWKGTMKYFLNIFLIFPRICIYQLFCGRKTLIM